MENRWKGVETWFSGVFISHFSVISPHFSIGSKDSSSFWFHYFKKIHQTCFLSIFKISNSSESSTFSKYSECIKVKRVDTLAENVTFGPDRFVKLVDKTIRYCKTRSKTAISTVSDQIVIIQHKRTKHKMAHFWTISSVWREKKSTFTTDRRVFFCFLTEKQFCFNFVFFVLFVSCHLLQICAPPSCSSFCPSVYDSSPHTPHSHTFPSNSITHFCPTLVIIQSRSDVIKSTKNKIKLKLPWHPFTLRETAW